MEVRKRAIRIGALGAMLFATSSMVFNGIAGAEPAKPHPGHVHFDKHGKEHNNLHWHVRIQGVDSLGKKFKKDVKVYNCDPRYAEADETMPDDEDTNPNHATTTTTTAPGGTTTTTAPGGTTTTTE